MRPLSNALSLGRNDAAKASFLTFMSAMTDDGADIRKALEIGNRILTAAGRAPLWFYENCAPVGDTADIDMMATQ